MVAAPTFDRTALDCGAHETCVVRGDTGRLFLRAKALVGTKAVVGDVPLREALERGFPRFGNVILEALASGLPVASVPAPGPIDLIDEGVNGAVDDDLAAADARAMRCCPQRARTSTDDYTFEASHQVFRSYWSIQLYRDGTE